MIETLLSLYSVFYYGLLTLGLIAAIITVPIITIAWVYGVLKDGIRYRIKSFIKQCFCDHEMKPDHDQGYCWHCTKCDHSFQRTG
jgi:hypothetical protein